MNSSLKSWVDEVAALTKPSGIHWCDGSEAENARLIEEMLASGTLHRLNPEKHPNCYLHRSDPSDVARTEHLTFICSKEQVDAGLLTPDQARVHPYSNVITRCVGAGSEVLPDIYFGALRAGDILLLASDGLTGMLEDDQLLRILQSDGGPEAWVDRMVAEANYRGGLDNITAIVVRIDSVD